MPWVQLARSAVPKLRIERPRESERSASGMCRADTRLAADGGCDEDLSAFLFGDPNHEVCSKREARGCLDAARHPHAKRLLERFEGALVG